MAGDRVMSSEQETPRLGRERAEGDDAKAIARPIPGVPSLGDEHITRAARALHESDCSCGEWDEMLLEARGYWLTRARVVLDAAGAVGDGTPPPDALADLEQRLLEARSRLDDMAAERAASVNDDDDVTAVRLFGKASGVGLALSYVWEMQNAAARGLVLPEPPQDQT